MENSESKKTWPKKTAGEKKGLKAVIQKEKFVIPTHPHRQRSIRYQSSTNGIQAHQVQKKPPNSIPCPI